MRDPGLMDFLARVHADDHDRIAEAFARAFTDHASLDEECRVLEPNGSLHWIEINGRPSRDGLNRTNQLEILIRDIGARKRIEAERNQLMRQLIQAEENERRILACALHDRASQTLSALALHLKTLEIAVDANKKHAVMQTLNTLAVELEMQLHAAANEAHPVALDDIGLVAALESLAADWSNRIGVDTEFRRAAENDPSLSKSTQLTLYRCIRELLYGIEQHGEAARVTLSVEETSHELRILIREILPSAAHAGRSDCGARPSVLSARLALVDAAMTQEVDGPISTTIIKAPLDPEKTL